MNKANPRDNTARGSGPDPRLLVIGGILYTVIGIGLALAAGRHLGASLRGEATDEITWNPLDTFLNTVSGKIEFHPVDLVIGLVLIALIVGVAGWLWWRLKGSKPKTQIDQAGSRYLSNNQDVRSLSRDNAAKAAARMFNNDQLAADHPGLRIGHMPGRKKAGLYSTWEDLYLVIFGPRMGKTTSQVIPAIVDAPGSVVTTSNKRDIVDDTIGITSARGTVRVFDPQNIASGFDQEPWFFDPLDYVRRVPDQMDSAAVGLADIFRCASRGADTGGDAYFSQAGVDLLAQFLLAAALDNRPITDVFLWTRDEDNRTPVTVLNQYPEWSQQAEALEGTYAITEKTRSGIFSQAAQMCAILGRRSAAQWVTPSAGRQRFDAAEFVRSQSRDTMYVLSKKGADNAAGLTTALVATIMVEAEAYGEESGGRLPVPLVAALDEAANVVKWPELPELYSHYGSRSIILMTILQSYVQGVGVWGEHGMEAMWSAASVMLFGGGVRDEKLLGKIETLVGVAEEETASVSSNRDGRSISHSTQERKIMTVADLASMPRGRALLLSSNRRPLVAQLEPWWERDWDDHTMQALTAKAN